MINADYICEDCNEITDYWKKYGKNFPKRVECSHCGSQNTRRIFSIGHISVPAGNCGNAKNGYSSNKK